MECSRLLCLRLQRRLASVLLTAAALCVHPLASEVPGPVEELLSVRPFVLAVRGWASQEECDRVLAVIKRCHDHQWPECKELHSKLHGKGNNHTMRAGKPLRNSTSFTLTIEGEADSAVDGLVRRAHALARHPVTYGEGVQVASYYPGDYYEFHHDALMRRATVLLYLTTVPEGGETIFPLVRAPGVPSDATPPLPPAVTGHHRGRGLDFKVDRMEPMAPYCDSDFYLKVKPEAGTAVLFFSYGPDYSMDIHAVHGACPVRSGHKAIFQRWMRFEENSLFAGANDALRRIRSELGNERLLQPGISGNASTSTTSTRPLTRSSALRSAPGHGGPEDETAPEL